MHQIFANDNVIGLYALRLYVNKYLITSIQLVAILITSKENPQKMKKYILEYFKNAVTMLQIDCGETKQRKKE